MGQGPTPARLDRRSPAGVVGHEDIWPLHHSQDRWGVGTTNARTSAIVTGQTKKDFNVRSRAGGSLRSGRVWGFLRDPVLRTVNWFDLPYGWSGSIVICRSIGGRDGWGGSWLVPACIGLLPWGWRATKTSSHYTVAETRRCLTFDCTASSNACTSSTLVAVSDQVETDLSVRDQTREHLWTERARTRQGDQVLRVVNPLGLSYGRKHRGMQAVGS